MNAQERWWVGNESRLACEVILGLKCNLLLGSTVLIVLHVHSSPRPLGRKDILVKFVQDHPDGKLAALCTMLKGSPFRFRRLSLRRQISASLWRC